MVRSSGLEDNVGPHMYSEKSVSLPCPQVLTRGNVLQSLAALGVNELTANVLQELVTMSMERINQFSPTDIGSLMRSMVLCGYEPSKDEWTILFARMFQSITQLASSFEASATSMCLWSTAMMHGTIHFKLREEFKLRLAQIACQLSFYDCGDTLWACSLLDIPLEPHTWSAIWKSALGAIADCDSTSLSNLMFAHGVWRTKPEQALLDAIKERTIAILADFAPDELANLTWAMGALSCELPEALTQAQQSNSVAALRTPCYRVHCKQVLVCVCVYVYICVLHRHLCVCVYMYICIYIYIFLHLYKCIYMYMYVYIYVYTNMIYVYSYVDTSLSCPQ